MTIDPATFRSVLGRFASGVTVVTARDESGTDHGMTVSAFCSLSLHPPLILMCVEQGAEMHPILERAHHCAVSILEEHQESLSRRFAEPMTDRFEGIGYTRQVTGAALLDDALAHVECELLERHPGGDHTIFIARVIAAGATSERPLIYYRGGYAQMER
ncbi:MAG TPA: flavin reductase family protein [Gemmatimonadaceae bacterium]|jgi:flavin reductase (DIM6/NTAB) family NADH-FMN oxidoreductase RutF|nr:flavin reductase family protein [Gemmatimonadaceae bacterium]